MTTCCKTFKYFIEMGYIVKYTTGNFAYLIPKDEHAINVVNMVGKRMQTNHIYFCPFCGKVISKIKNTKLEKDLERLKHKCRKD